MFRTDANEISELLNDSVDGLLEGVFSCGLTEHFP